ncbi:MAG: DUF2330 domain-containing protein [Alphaproteobacteria bacterium]|nr:DUF2330 domain-containing protein [Alphaproteobacteria bacterium]MCB9793561.1 DUF2330 domain-containing protein [Alphaproteobacteria bacterium]
MPRVLHLGLAASLAAALFVPAQAQAFCGFYVSGADASLYNNATLVVMMRDGTRTVLSMQNNYQGPTEDFALVIPVPVVLQEDNVKTLPKEIFQRIDSLSAPRLVEYWEQDPCAPPVMYDLMMRSMAVPEMAVESEFEDAGDFGVTVEAQFSVAEYDIVILSAKDSGGLDAWLRKEKYNIPEGAETVLRGYVEQGTKFFVAKVDAEKVTFVDGQAVLSPIRVHYDSDAFSLPVRLGLLNSEGEQDLLVHILAKGQRYEAANYDNAFIPTNIRVLEGAKQDFGDFYSALFQKTVADKPKTVVTEYSWDASSCDPCPTPALDYNELATLGTDVLNGDNWGWVLTRLHYRYTKDTLGEDLVFKAAPPMVGGRGTPDQKGELAEQQPVSSGMNNFQGRYYMLHPWEGEITCDNPMRGNWGGPGGRSEPPPMGAPSELSGSRKGDGKANLPELVDEDIPWIGVKAAAASSKGGDLKTPAPLSPAEGAPPSLEDGEPDVDDERGCSTAPAAGLGAGLLALLGLALRRRRG